MTNNITLEEKLEATFLELKTPVSHQNILLGFLETLKQKDIATYQHSIRVPLLGIKIARHIHSDPKPMLYAGLIHDLGKAYLDSELLTKKDFKEEDLEKMKSHPLAAYELTKDIFAYSAEVALRHHKHQPNGYPKTFPDCTIKFSENTKLMQSYHSRILSLIDFYDAVSNRPNNKFGANVSALSPENIRKIILENNTDQHHLIVDLYNNHIFGAANSSCVKDIDDEKYAMIWNDWEEKRSSEDTRRFVTLAAALEPLSEKIGCTTRSSNNQEHQKLEYFVSGAINIGDAFAKLAERVISLGRQPALTYDYATDAQIKSKMNRAGGRVNQGIIEMLLPIIISQMINDPYYKKSAQEILAGTKEVMRKTTSEDVEQLIAMKRHAYDLSGYKDRTIPVYPEAKNVYSYYAADYKNSIKETSIKHNEEFVLGFPTVKKLYELMMASNETSLNRKVEEAYDEVRRTMHKDAAAGLTADCVACAIYLMLSHHPKEKIII